jgi:hypothetical protein
MLNKSLTPESDTRTILLNPDIFPRRIIVPIDDGSHAMGYKDYSSNLDICPRIMTILDHFPSGHYCEIMESIFHVPIFPLRSLL